MCIRDRTYTDSNGVSTDLYSSDTVGGEEAAGGEEGLHEIANTPGEYFYLERLQQGETGRVTLWMRVDGETQGNGYQETLAHLQMNFAVEEVPEAQVLSLIHILLNLHLFPPPVASVLPSSPSAAALS